MRLSCVKILKYLLVKCGRANGILRMMSPTTLAIPIFRSTSKWKPFKGPPAIELYLSEIEKKLFSKLPDFPEHKPYRKPNEKPLYINKDSNYPRGPRSNIDRGLYLYIHVLQYGFLFKAENFLFFHGM